MHILLVDDQPQIIGQILSHYGGYQVTIANDGHEAIQKLSEKPHEFDLIILDVNMPRVNGWDTLNFIRNTANTLTTYVIMLTSSTEEASLIRGLRRGADEYLMKPISPSRLLAHIDSIERRLECNRHKEEHSVSESLDTEHIKLLTSREKEILFYIVQGLSNQKIAENLVISEITVKNHLGSIYRKLQVSNRNQAAYIGQKLQLQPPH